MVQSSFAHASRSAVMHRHPSSWAQLSVSSDVWDMPPHHAVLAYSEVTLPCCTRQQQPRRLN